MTTTTTKKLVNTKQGNSCELFVKEGEYDSTKHVYLLESCLTVLKRWPSQHIFLATALLLEIMKTFLSGKLSSAFQSRS